MEKFTYADYLKYKEKETLKLNLCEQETIYKIESTHQYKDKSYKIILENKEEASKFINKTLKINNTRYEIKKEELEKYNRSFITVDFRTKESDIIYKIKNKNIFILIEHQSKVDKTMPYRILNYCVEIIRNAIDIKQMNSVNYKMPTVYPIVLYTGKRKWNVKKSFEDSQDKLKGVRREKFTQYNIFDINEHSEEELWKEDNFLSKMLLFEKAKTDEEIEKFIDKIDKNKLTDINRNVLKHVIYCAFSKRTDEETINRYIEKIEERKERGYMCAFTDYLERLLDQKIAIREKECSKRGLEKGMKEGLEKGMKEGLERGMKEGLERGIKQGLDKGIKQGIREGRKEGRKEGKEQGKKEEKIKIIKNMLKNKIGDELIKKMTKITEKELEEIKQTI